LIGEGVKIEVRKSMIFLMTYHAPKLFDAIKKNFLVKFVFPPFNMNEMKNCALII
jgi:hypothetical protein